MGNWAYDEKRGALRRKEGDGKEVEVVWAIGHMMRREERYVGRRAMERRLKWYGQLGI